MYRIVKEEDDLKLASETDKNLADMGFELTLDAVRAKHGEGWEKKVMPPAHEPSPAPILSPASFAEPAASRGQIAIDQAVASMPEDALAAAEAAYPTMDKAKLQHLLAWAMFGGEAYRRQAEP